MKEVHGRATSEQVSYTAQPFYGCLLRTHPLKPWKSKDIVDWSLFRFNSTVAAYIVEIVSIYNKR